VKLQQVEAEGKIAFKKLDSTKKVPSSKICFNGWHATKLIRNFFEPTIIEWFTLQHEARCNLQKLTLPIRMNGAGIEYTIENTQNSTTNLNFHCRRLMS